MDIRDFNPFFNPAPFPAAREQIKESFLKSNQALPESFLIDGKIHRYKVSDDDDKKSGWYIFFEHFLEERELIVGCFGSWRDGLKYDFISCTGRELTVEEMHEQRALMEEVRKQRELARVALHQEAAERAKKIYEESLPATSEHPYLNKKRVDSFGLKISERGDIIIPVYDIFDNLSSLQFVNTDGGKKFLFGGKTKECFLQLGEAGSKIFFCEGYATGATAHQATGVCVVVCFSASNMSDVVKNFRTKHKTSEFVIIADNDESGIGQKSAENCAELYGASVILPPDVGQDLNDFMLSGGNVVKLLNPPRAEWFLDANDFCNQPLPLKWIIRKWLPEKSLIMLTGASGGGKTFVALEMILSIASGFDSWSGFKVNPAPVVYLAGEGHAGIRARVAAWKQEKNPDGKFDLWVSKSGKNLDDGIERIKIINDIKLLPKKPKLIVIDTLHRFLGGDENKAQDSGKFTTACHELQEIFDCAVMIVHHTGLSDDERARGSSAWRGALDVELNVKSKKDKIILKQIKQKDIELVDEIYFDKRVITINGWIDDDGEEVTSLVLTSGNAPAPAENKKSYEYLVTLAEGWTGEVNSSRMVIDAALAIDKQLEKGLSEKASRNKINICIRELLTQKKLLQLNDDLYILNDAVFNMRARC